MTLVDSRKTLQQRRAEMEDNLKLGDSGAVKNVSESQKMYIATKLGGNTYFVHCKGSVEHSVTVQRG